MRVSGMFGLSVKSKMIQILKVNFKKSFKSKVCWKSPGNKATPIMLRIARELERKTFQEKNVETKGMLNMPPENP